MNKTPSRCCRVQSKLRFKLPLGFAPPCATQFLLSSFFFCNIALTLFCPLDWPLLAHIAPAT